MLANRVSIALTVLGGLLFSPLTSVSAADPAADVHSRVGTVVPIPGRAFIEGVVRDESGHYLDDINVEAFAAGSEDSDPIASSITYESPDSEHAHGFYRLRVPPGNYQIRYSVLDGDDDELLSKWYADKRVVNVGDQEVLSLKPVTLERKRPETDCRMGLVDDVVVAGERSKVRIRVTSPGSKRVTGSIKVTMNDRKVRTDRLSKLDHGRVVLQLPKRRPGTYRVMVSYAGSDALKGSHSSAHVLTVLRKGSHSRRTVFNGW